MTLRSSEKNSRKLQLIPNDEIKSYRKTKMIYGSD
jgi:hypothetical protein